MTEINETELHTYILEHRIEVERDAAEKQAASRKPRLTAPSIPDGCMGFITTASLFAADKYSRVKHFDDFATVFESLRQKYKLGPVNARIAERVNMTEDYFNRLFSRNGISERGALWALAMGLKLSIEDAEKLFESCGQSLRGSYYIKKPGKEEEYNSQVDREGFLLYFLERPNEYDDIDDINAELSKRGMKLLGNCT